MRSARPDCRKQVFKSEAGVPRPILVAGNLLRAAVFLWPLLLPLSRQDQRSRAGIALYALLSLLFVGVHVYHNILAHGSP
jgi:hypothetical protein